MEYNSSREILTIAEYGRHVQKMIDYAKTVEDDEKRQAVANEVVNLMLRMQNSNRNDPDMIEKMWKHFFKIANYDIAVKTPSGEVPQPSEGQITPNRIHYRKRLRAFRHYGQHIRRLIEKVETMEDGPKKDALEVYIGSFMKLAYQNWNKEHYVNDKPIKEDLIKLSQGKINIDDDINLDMLKKSSTYRSSNNHSKRNNKSNKGKSKRYRKY